MYKFNLNNCCNNGKLGVRNRGDGEYGQLLQLVKVDFRFSSFIFYKHLDSIQFNSISNKNSKEYICNNSGHNRNSGGSSNSNGNDRVLIHSMRPYGMISSLHFLGYCLTRSLEFNRTLIVDDNEFLFSNYITDLILPVSNKESIQVLNHLKEKEYDNSKRISIITQDYRVYVDFISCSKFPNQFFLNNDLYLFKSHIMNWLIRPNYKIRRQIEHYKKQWYDNTNTNDKCLAIQIRNGDKIIELNKSNNNYTTNNNTTNNNNNNNNTNRLIYLNEYINFIKGDSYCKQFSNIFILTDNQTVIDDELPIIEKNNPHLKFHYLKDIIRNHETYKFGDYLFSNNYGETSDDDNYATTTAAHTTPTNDYADAGTGGIKKLKAKPNSKIGEGLLIEILLASECDFFLGSLRSNVARLIVELMNANRLTSPSLRIQLFKSLDNSNWFADP